MVSRNQIEALPNFSMTDYASQGKTREYNVVDLGQTRNHHGYYTALSRGSTACGTLILSGLHPKHITGGASGALHQEFRELELLDCITTMRYEGKLPAKMAMANRRNTLIEMFRQHKGLDFIPHTVPDTLKWSKNDPYLEWKHNDIDWAIIKAAEQKTVDSLNRKAPYSEHVDSPALKCIQPTSLNSSSTHPLNDGKLTKKEQVPVSQAPHFTDTWQPLGTIWQNNSCAYDAVITILFNIWRENPPATTGLWQTMGNVGLNSLLAGFILHTSMPQSHSQQFTLENIRDYMRRRLARISPTFAFGQYASVHNILLHLLDTSNTVTINTRRCIAHGHTATHESNIATAMISVSGEHGRTAQQNINDPHVTLSSRCHECNNFQVRTTTFQTLPPLLACEWGTQPPILNPNLTITGQDTQTATYHLRGIIYHHGDHFTAHIINSAGQMWYHDGMQTGPQRTLIPEQAGTHPYANAIVAIYSHN
jgi:hypothetical protein